MYGLYALIIVVGLIVVVFASFFLAWYLIKKIRIKETAMLMEKGIDIKDLNALNQKKGNFLWLKTGILLIGIALGTLLVAFLMRADDMQLSNRNSGLSFGIIVLFAGISMIVANFVANSKERNN